MSLTYGLAEDITRCFTKDPLLLSILCQDLWQPPPTSFVKLNVDGSVLRSLHRGGFGGLARDENEV